MIAELDLIAGPKVEEVSTPEIVPDVALEDIHIFRPYSYVSMKPPTYMPDEERTVIRRSSRREPEYPHLEKWGDEEVEVVATLPTRRGLEVIIKGHHLGIGIPIIGLTGRETRVTLTRRSPKEVIKEKPPLWVANL